MLSRRSPASSLRRCNLNPRPLILLRTLCRSPRAQPLCNQANPHSFVKTPGVGCTSQKLPNRISNLRTLRFRSICKPVIPPETSCSKSFRMRIYASSRPNSFIYRIYAKRPGGGGGPSTILRGAHCKGACGEDARGAIPHKFLQLSACLCRIHLPCAASNLVHGNATKEKRS